MPRFHIRHSTKYTYESMVRDSANQLMLCPLSDQWQHVMNYELKVSGDPAVEVHNDYFGNIVQTFTLTEPHEELTIISSFSVNTEHKPLPEPAVTTQHTDLSVYKTQMEFIDFLKPANLSALPELSAIIEQEKTSGHTAYQVMEYCSNYIFQHFQYIKGVTTIETTIEEIWKLKAGVCQDFAHLLLAMLRNLGIPARYVSGYICPEKNEMRGIGATHAWVEAFLPAYGWMGIDPTNNCIANEHHVKLAAGRNFSDCSPVKGTYRGTSRHTLDVVVNVNYDDTPVQRQEQRNPLRNQLIRKQHEQSQQQQ